MKRSISILFFLLSSAAWPQSMMIGVDRADTSASYVGPGNVISGAVIFWGLRAYNAAYATGLNKIANICTPADAVCADVNSDASGNFNLAGTGSLTCNNSGSICTIKTLYDQSGANSCGGSPCNLTQATIANRATLVVPGAANGCPTASKFCASTVDGVSYSTGTTINQIQPLTISAVYNNPVRTRDEYILDGGSGNLKMLSGSGGANAITIQVVSSLTATAADATYHAVQGVVCCIGNSGASSDMNVDGTSNTGTVGGTNGLNTATVTLFDVTGFGLIGFWDETGVWPVAFTPTNSSNMSSNQHAYWGF